jgi:hypothetical protein
MGFMFMNNSRYYGKYLNSKVNSINQMINFQNTFFMMTLSSYLLGKRITLCDNTLKLSFSSNSESLLTLSSSYELSTLKKALRTLLSLKSGAIQMALIQLLNLCRQWPGLDIQSSGMIALVTNRGLEPTHN